MPLTSRERQSLPPVIQAMLTPDFYPEPAPNIELRQTHTSYVLLAGAFVYKVRKAVRFAFIDCSTPARRRVLCERELELNRRLSPDVYLAVVAIRQTAGRFVLDQGSHDSSGAIEFAVKMRRLPEEQRLDHLVSGWTVTPDDILKLAQTIRNFHNSTPNTHSWAHGAAASIWRMTIRNLTEIEQFGPGEALLAKIAQIESYSRKYVASHWELLNRRARDGRVREGHGDLRTDAVYLTPQGIKIIDCLEFDERLRYCDIANEVAFLAMDLDRLGRTDSSRALIAHFHADPDISLLIPFYKAYRATVRAKVELLRSRQPDCSDEERENALARAVFLLDLALGYTHGPKSLLIVCGASGIGKSSLAAILSEHLDCTIVSSDTVRKRLAGIEPHISAAAGYNQGIYTAEFTSQVYQSLVAQAKEILNKENKVILDATFGRRSQRHLIIEMAKEAGMEPLFIECRASQDTILQRLSKRQQDSGQISDANVEIYLSQIKEFEPLDEIPPARHQVVVTTGELAPAVLEIERRVYSIADAA